MLQFAAWYDDAGEVASLVSTLMALMVESLSSYSMNGVPPESRPCSVVWATLWGLGESLLSCGGAASVAVSYVAVAC